MKSERLAEYRCPCCFKHMVYHDWLAGTNPEDDGFRHILKCTNCGRSTLPMDNVEQAIEAFVQGLETCWYADATTVLIDISKLNELIKSGTPITQRQLDKLDLRRRLG